MPEKIEKLTCITDANIVVLFNSYMSCKERMRIPNLPQEVRMILETLRDKQHGGESFAQKWLIRGTKEMLILSLHQKQDDKLEVCGVCVCGTSSCLEYHKKLQCLCTKIVRDLV